MCVCTSVENRDRDRARFGLFPDTLRILWHFEFGHFGLKPAIWVGGSGTRPFFGCFWPEKPRSKMSCMSEKSQLRSLEWIVPIRFHFHHKQQQRHCFVRSFLWLILQSGERRFLFVYLGITSNRYC